MSLSTLFKSNVTVNAHTSEDFLKLTKKCMERVRKMTSKGIMFTPPKFNYDQCKYLADKLKLVMESAETLPPEDITNCFEIIKLVYGFANVVENFIQSCRQDRWIQATMTMTSLSEHISLLGFYLEVISQSFCRVLTSTSIDSIYQSEVKIVEEKAYNDQESLLKNLYALLQTKPTNWKVYQLATLLFETLQQPQGHKDGSTPRFFHNDKDNLKEKEKLGRGAFATVFKASWLGMEVAKKTFYSRDSPDFEKEVSILQTLSHPNITSLFGYGKDDQECFMVMELMDEDLFSLIRRRMKENKTRGYPFDILEAIDMMLQIGGGMKYLHEMQIVHRDLKSMNILVKYVKTKDKKIAYVLAKVSDFGLSRIKLKSLTQSNQTPNMGTARWMAPEMIKLHLAESSIETLNIDANVTKHPFKSDVYSFAMVCYEILSGEMPYFEEHNLNEVKKKVLKGDRPQLPNHSPSGMKSLMEKCWNADASKRPCFIEIFAELQRLQCSLLMSLGNNFQAKKFTIAELIRITNNFSASHKIQAKTFKTPDEVLVVEDQLIETGHIGGGELNTVYKGKLPDETAVAVKRLAITTPEFGNKESAKALEAKLEILGHIRHKSLVKVLGYCSSSETKALVLEYMPNGSLDSFLHPPENVEVNRAFDWTVRLKIALEVAAGLKYLHMESWHPIVHGDVKPSNILFDAKMETRIANYGVPRVLKEQGFIPKTSPSSSVAAAHGYTAPDVASSGIPSMEGDVYSFGIILLQMITGRNPFILEPNQTLPQWVRATLSNSPALQNMLDPQLMPELPMHSQKMAMMLGVALLCTRLEPQERPNMGELHKMLVHIQSWFSENSTSQREGLMSSTRRRSLRTSSAREVQPVSSHEGLLHTLSLSEWTPSNTVFFGKKESSPSWRKGLMSFTRRSLKKTSFVREVQPMSRLPHTPSLSLSDLTPSDTVFYVDKYIN